MSNRRSQRPRLSRARGAPWWVCLLVACGGGEASDDSVEAPEIAGEIEDDPLGSPEDERDVRSLLPALDVPQTSSILLISLDTLRADRLSVYGSKVPTTPQLERFATHATKYTRAQAAAPWTLPSHASMFTGLYPFEHGAHTIDLEGEHVRDRENNAVPLGKHFVTLAEYLAHNGFQTGGFVANRGYLSRRFQLDQGFSYYDVKAGTVDEVSQRFVTWLRNRRDRPFFAFLNLMDTHRPYNTEPLDGWPDYGEDRYSGRLIVELQPKILAGEEVPQEKLDLLNNLYDLAIANLDAGLGQLFRRLKRLDVYDDCLIVLVGDHGEFLGEHALIEHSKDVYEGTMHVPLLIKAPGQTEARVDDQLISHVHLPGLILAHAALDKTLRRSAPLVRHWPRGPVLGENYFSRLHDLRSPYGERFDRVRTVLYDGTQKFIHSTDGEHELFDLASDRDELRNLLDDPELEAWRDRVRALMPEGRRARAGEVPILDERERSVLEQLGYIEGANDDDDADPDDGP